MLAKMRMKKCEQKRNWEKRFESVKLLLFTRIAIRTIVRIIRSKEFCVSHLIFACKSCVAKMTVVMTCVWWNLRGINYLNINIFTIQPNSQNLLSISLFLLATNQPTQLPDQMNQAVSQLNKSEANLSSFSPFDQAAFLNSLLPIRNLSISN